MSEVICVTIFSISCIIPDSHLKCLKTFLKVGVLSYLNNKGIKYECIWVPSKMLLPMFRYYWYNSDKIMEFKIYCSSSANNKVH